MEAKKKALQIPLPICGVIIRFHRNGKPERLECAFSIRIFPEPTESHYRTPLAPSPDIIWDQDPVVNTRPTYHIL